MPSFEYMKSENTRNYLDGIIIKWENELGRNLTISELELIEMTEGEVDLRLGYCPSIFGSVLEV